MHSMRWVALLIAALMVMIIPVGAAAQRSSAVGQDGPAATQDKTRAVNTFTNIPVEGTTEDGGTFRGVLDIINFRVIDGDLIAVGELTGTVRDADGGRVGRVQDERVRLPLILANASSCDILKLRLGPLDLDLLGLQIHLDRIVLDITAEAGPGNLLGNLLCAIAGLLDGGLNLNTVLRDLLRAVLGVFDL